MISEDLIIVACKRLNELYEEALALSVDDDRLKINARTTDLTTALILRAVAINSLIEHLPFAPKLAQKTLVYQDKSASELSDKALRFLILTRDEYRCVYCGNGVQDGKKLHIDHLIPTSAGGAEREIFNLVTACDDCNLSKSDKVLTSELLLKMRQLTKRGIDNPTRDTLES